MSKRMNVKNIAMGIVSIIMLAVVLVIGIILACANKDKNPVNDIDGFEVTYTSRETMPGETLDYIVDTYYHDTATAAYYSDEEIKNAIVELNSLKSEDKITSYCYLMMPYLSKDNGKTI